MKANASLTNIAAFGLAQCQSPKLPTHDRARKAFERAFRSSDFFPNLAQFVDQESGGKVHLFGYTPKAAAPGKYFLVENGKANFVGVISNEWPNPIKLIGDRDSVPGTDFEIKAPKKAEVKGQSKTLDAAFDKANTAAPAPAATPAAEPEPTTSEPATEVVADAPTTATTPAAKPKRTRKAKVVTEGEQKPAENAAPKPRTRKPTIKDAAAAPKPSLMERAKNVARRVTGKGRGRQSSGS